MRNFIALILFISINCFAQASDKNFIEMNDIENFSYGENNKKGLIEFIQLNIEVMNKKDLRFFHKNEKITELNIYPEKALFPKKENETADVSYKDILQEAGADKGIYVIYSSYLYKNEKNRWCMANISIFSSPPITINSFNKDDFAKIGITGENPFVIEFYKHTEKKLIIEKKFQDTRVARYKTTIKNGKDTLSLKFIVGKDGYNPNDKFPYKWNTLIIEKVD